MLLSEKEKRKRTQRPTTLLDEQRYHSVKKSMAAIKFVLSERAAIDKLIEKENVQS